MQFRHAAIEVDASVSIGSCINALLLVEMIGLPIGKLSILADTLTEEIGPKFLKAKIFDAHTCRNVLEVNPSCRMEAFVAMGQHTPIVVE